MFNKDSYEPLPVYRVMDPNGNVINPEHDPKVKYSFSAFLSLFISCLVAIGRPTDGPTDRPSDGRFFSYSDTFVAIPLRSHRPVDT